MTDATIPNDALFRAQVTRLFERSAFYRDKLNRAGFSTVDDVGGSSRSASCRSRRRMKCAPHSRRLCPGFLPRGLSYACRRPKLFTEAEWQLTARRSPKPDRPDTAP